MRYLYETLCRFAPALECSRKLFMLSRHDPLFVRPFLAAECECSDVESLARVYWVTHSCLACLAIKLHDLKDSGSSLPGPHNVTAF